MPFGRPGAEAGREAVEELRGQRNFGHQYQRLLPAPHAFGHRLEIDLRLARSGHAVEQRDAVAALRDGRAQCIRGRTLRRNEVGRCEVGIRLPRHRPGRQHQRLQRALIDQTVDHARRDAGVLRRIALCPGEAVGEQGEHPLACRRHSLRRRADEPHADAFARGPEVLAHAQRHAQHHAARRQRIVRDPIDEPPHLGLERRHIELMLDVLELIVQSGPDLHIVGPHHAGGLADAKRYRDQIAGLEVEMVRHPVRISVVECDRHQNIDKMTGHGNPADSRCLRKPEGRGEI